MMKSREHQKLDPTTVRSADGDSKSVELPSGNKAKKNEDVVICYIAMEAMAHRIR